MPAIPVGERPVRSLRQMFREEQHGSAFAANGVRRFQARRIPPKPASSTEGAREIQPVHAAPAVGFHYPGDSASDSSSEELDSIGGQNVTSGALSAACAHNLRGTRSGAESEKKRDIWLLASSTQRAPHSFLSPPGSLRSSPRANEETKMRRTSSEHRAKAYPLSSDVESLSQSWTAPPSRMQSASSILGRHKGVPQSPSHFEYAVATLSQKEGEALENWCDIVERKIAQTRLPSFCTFFAAVATQKHAHKN